jgi:hypothetical protein
VKARSALAFLASLGLLLGAALLLVRQATDPDQVAGAPPARQVREPEPPRGPPPVTSTTPPEVADPVEALELERLIETRARYRSLRDGFKGPASEASRQRVEPALRSLWPEAGAFDLGCRGRVCRVEGPGRPVDWQRALRDHPGVVAVTDQVALDPDGQERPAYLVVSDGRAGSGEDLLGGLERQLRESEETQACLVGSGTIEYELMVDETGVTYRAGGTAPQPVIDCVGRALAEVISAIKVPPATKTASRAVTLLAGR